MEGFRERQISTINTIEDRVNGHKNFLMGKKRIRYSFEEIVSMKVAQLRTRIYKHALPCGNWEKREAYYKNVGEYEYIDADFAPIEVGEKWGGPDVTCFFRNEIEIPKELDGERVELQLYVGGDSLVSVNGEPRQGLDPFRNSLVLTPCAKAGEKFKVEVESYCFYAAPSEGAQKRTFECSALTVTDKEIEEIYWDWKVALNLLSIVGVDEYMADYIKEVFRSAINYIDMDTADHTEFMDKLRKGQAILKEKIYRSDKFRPEGIIDLVGHSHLDIVYMWDYKEFVRKAGRTHATMLALMDEFPEFKFCQSQAVTYKEIKENFPTLFERIKEYVKEGRWEIIGGMWVEPDCNLPGGESFVRQLLEGRKFFQKEFNVTPRTVWLPDVFGNSYGMPQILAKSGIKYFVTHKPCVWNDTNQIPHHTFWWQGPDGSRVFAALSASHFVGTCEPNHIMVNWDKFTDKAKIGESMYCYGWGDGGGGVSVDMIENAKRMKHIVGMPDTRIVNGEEALDSIFEKANGKELPVLQNEIYLEAHRAVPIIRTEIKKYNRRCERLFREAELYGAIAQKYGYEYPKKEMEKAWQIMLTNQFHDILPGTHVGIGYQGIISEYEKAVSIGEAIRDKALSIIAKEIKFDECDKKAFAVFNSLSYEVTSIVKLPKGDFGITDSEGNDVKTQVCKQLNGEEFVCFTATHIPAFGFKVYYIGDGKVSDQKCATVEKDAIENRFFKITFNENGDISSIFDKMNNREVIKEYGNKISIFNDNPSSHDAWDIVEEYRDFEIEIPAGEITAFENGAVLASVLLTKKFLNSKLEQKITVYDEIDRIDFETKVDWHETQKVLRADFDFDVITDKYTTNLAYASLERPINAYNSFDEAKFEVCAQDFIDISEEGYGASILSDVKNGYTVRGTMMSLGLLKAPIGPDNTCDRGINEFTYSLYPHEGTWKSGNTVSKFGAFANEMPIVELSKSGNEEGGFIACNCDNVIVEAVKPAEDGDGVIIRVLEKYGRRTNAKLAFGDKISKAQECDLMETVINDAKISENAVEFTIKPYEIKSFKFK